nr:reverse transcriptase domain-containing protein [Tanacetum cinerariifolium]
MADNRTMEEILQAPTKGYGDAIVVPDIIAENFEIRIGLLSLIQANQFHGFESNNSHDHVRSFNRITSTFKFRDVPNDAIKLMLFLYSLKGAAKIWKLHFDLSFADALLHMPKFTLMFKSLLNNKDKLFNLATTPMNENCSALDECLALADLGASINLMPLFIWKNLSLPELTPTRMILELADRSMTRPADIAEDVLVKVGKFHFPTDFIVVDYVVNPRVPLILGRPFLRTRRALIDVYGEELTLRIDDEVTTFKVGQTSKYSYNDDELIHQIDVIDVACEEYVQEELLNNDPSSFPLPPKELNVEEIKTAKSSIDEPPELELKELPSHLEYTFLEGTNKLLIIFSKELKDEEKSTLLKCHLMVKEGIVLDHKIYKSEIEVDRAKVDVIAKLPHPTSVKVGAVLGQRKTIVYTDHSGLKYLLAKQDAKSIFLNLFPPLDNPELTIRRRSRADPTLLNDFEMSAEGNGDPPVPDLQNMDELCQPSLNGRGGPIAPISIQETNFGLNNDMIQQVQNSCQFHVLSGDDANKHLDKFLHVTQSIRVNGVTDDALRLYLFPHSLTHHVPACFDHMPMNSINTFEQMAKLFIGKYFPPSMVTKLRNEITNFCQRPDESLFEAWEHYKISIDRCPNHNMFPVTQIDTFYKGLTLRHRDTINAAAGGTIMKRRPGECYDLIENMTAHRNDLDTSAQRSESSSLITSSSDTEITTLKAEMAEINKNLMRFLQVNQQVKEVTPRFNQNQNRNNPNQNFQNQGNIHPQWNNQGRNQFFQGASHVQNPPPAYQAPAYQAPDYQASVHQPLIPQPQVVTTNEFTNIMKENDDILKNMQTNMTSLTNSNLELKNMFGQFMKMNSASSLGLGTLPGNTITNSKEDLKGITTRSETAYQGPTIPNTSSSFPKVVERETEVTKDTLPEKLGDPGKFLIPCDFPRMAECLALADLGASINLMPLSVWNKLSLPGLSPTCMTLELADRSISRLVRVAEDVFVKVGTFHFSADFVVVDFDADPRVPIILGRSFLKTERAFINVLKGELTLRAGKEAITFNLDQTLRYSANYNDMTANRIDVINMACEEYSQEVLGFLNVITSGNPTPYYNPIVSTSSPTLTLFEDSDFLLEGVDAFLALKDDATLPKVDQSYFNLEGDILLLESFINDDPSLPPPNHGNYLPQVRKKLKICEAKNDKSSIDEPLEVALKDLPPHLEYAFLEEDDFKPAVQHQRRVNPKIHDVIKKEVLKLLDVELIYPISDSPWISPIHCVPKKGGFTVVDNEENELIPTRLVTGWLVCIDYRKLKEANRKDHFPLPFMDRILERLARNEYYCFLDEKMLKRCEDTNLYLNWEKSHFMVKEGILLGHKISKNRIEVDKAKVNVIAKLPHPTTVKGIRIFLGHAGLYRRFIQDFSMIA